MSAPFGTTGDHYDMEMRLVIAVLLAAGAVDGLAGCNQIYGLDETRLRDQPDAPPGICPAGTTLQHQSIPAFADATIIDDGNPQNHGDVPEVFMHDAAPSQYGLWKFDVQTGLDRAVDATLVLPYIVRELDCGPNGGTTCAPCDANEAAGTLTAYALSSDWDERTNNWDCKTGAPNCTSANPRSGTLWDVPGAGGSDRGPELASVDHVAAGDTELPLGDSLPLLRSWVQTGVLSMIVVPSRGARVWIPAIANDPIHLECRPPAVAFLSVSYCV